MRGRAAWMVVVAACAPAAQPPVLAPAPRSVPEAPEQTSEGNAQVTVLARPDDPRAAPRPEAAATTMTTERCRTLPACTGAGLCTSVAGVCRAAGYADCEQMPACAGGKCTLAAG